MFLPVLKGQSTDEQYKKWGLLAEDFRMIGCYAQTELGHGSNLSGLETTSTYQKSTDGFVLNSPSLTSLKWWVGGLGVICTHALIQAKLIVSQKDYGPHLFIVQVRSLEDHKPMPGVQVGDIGAKFGMAKSDNGWVRFDNVHISRDQMLSRFASVSKDGRYIPPIHPKLSYGGMVLIRAQLVEMAGIHLAKAVTIATRYSTVRRQFHPNDSLTSTERPVISYRMVKYRLFPLIATTYIFRILGQRVTFLYDQMNLELQSKKANLLPHVHAITSGCKSFCTTAAANAIEECRKICGGHGFSKYAGFFHLYTEYVASNTYEGDNALLTQQISRYLMKCWNGRVKDQSLLWMNPRGYNHKLTFPTIALSGEVGHFLEIFRHRVCRLVGELSDDLQTVSFEEKNVLCGRICVAFCQYYALESFHLFLQSSSPNMQALTKKVLQKIRNEGLFRFW